MGNTCICNHASKDTQINIEKDRCSVNLDQSLEKPANCQEGKSRKSTNHLEFDPTILETEIVEKKKKFIPIPLTNIPIITSPQVLSRLEELGDYEYNNPEYDDYKSTMDENPFQMEDGTIYIGK